MTDMTQAVIDTSSVLPSVSAGAVRTVHPIGPLGFLSDHVGVRFEVNLG